MSTCIFLNKPMVEDEFIGVIVRSLDIMNFVFFFINPLPQLHVPDLTFGLVGYVLTMLPFLERDRSMFLATLKLEYPW